MAHDFRFLPPNLCRSECCLLWIHPLRNKTATSNKCIATSNKCLTSSNSKLLETIVVYLVFRVGPSRCIGSSRWDPWRRSSTPGAWFPRRFHERPQISAVPLWLSSWRSCLLIFFGKKHICWRQRLMHLKGFICHIWLWQGDTRKFHMEI